MAAQIEIENIEVVDNDTKVDTEVTFKIWLNETNKNFDYSRSDAEVFCGNEVGVL